VKRDIVLLGGGGHCRACIDVIERGGDFAVVCIVDLPERLGARVLGYPVSATDTDLPALVQRHGLFLVTAGQIKSPKLRIRLFEAVSALGGELPVIVSPLAYVSPHARLGAGTIVMHGAMVNAGAEVGRNCIINSRALVEHDVVIGDHCHISTGALINGGVVVGEETFWGSGAVSREGVHVGRGCIIGCNATIKQSLTAGEIIR